MPGTTPVYGFPYPEPTDLVADYPALGQQLAEDIEGVLPTIGGLAPATPTSIANSGGTATLSGNTVTFSGVTSVSLNSCFSSSWKNYRIVMRSAASSGTPNMFLRYRAAGADESTAIYYYSQNYGTGNNASSGDTTILHGSLSAAVNGIVWDSLNPFAAAQTQGIGLNIRTFSPLALMMGHLVFSNTSYNGFTCYVTTGTMSGDISVYGYKA